MKLDLYIWGGSSTVLAALKLLGVIDWPWPLVVAPLVVPITVWAAIVIAAAAVWPFRWLAGARETHNSRRD